MKVIEVRQDLFKRIANNPKDVDFKELDAVLTRCGFERRSPKAGSSHFTYSHPKLDDILTVPFSHPVKAV